ncbi:MAG: TetR/AcrR family transcriptional regulator [Proteobacteria bacterium]|nr:TetR/AcrR family transcriptional regulator [Pseudomonadota bacterium]
MKRDKHKMAVKSRVLEVAKQLFIAQGYSKTTIKEITQKAEITTGSLYHFFKDKEDILLHMTQEVFDLAATMSDDILGQDNDPWLRLSLEIALQFNLILSHGPIGELYLLSYESEAISRYIVQRAQARNQDMFQASLPHVTHDEFYIMCLAIKGILHSFIQDALYNKKHGGPMVIYRALDMVLLIFQIPKGRLDGVISKTHALIPK